MALRISITFSRITPVASVCAMPVPELFLNTSAEDCSQSNPRCTPAISHSGLLHFQRPQPGKNLARRQRSVPNHGLALIVGPGRGMAFHKLLDFIVDGLLQHALGSLAEQLFKFLLALGHSRGLRLNGNYVALIHVCVLLSPSRGGFDHPQDSHTPLLPIHNFRKYLSLAIVEAVPESLRPEDYVCECET